MRTQWIALIALQAATSVLGAGVHQQSVQTVGPYLLVPVAGSARGVGNTDFKTDLTIRNGGNSNANVQLLFLPANRDNSVSDKTVVVATIDNVTDRNGDLTDLTLLQIARTITVRLNTARILETKAKTLRLENQMVNWFMTMTLKRQRI